MRNLLFLITIILMVLIIIIFNFHEALHTQWSHYLLDQEPIGNWHGIVWNNLHSTLYQWPMAHTNILPWQLRDTQFCIHSQLIMTYRRDYILGIFIWTNLMSLYNFNICRHKRSHSCVVVEDGFLVIVLDVITSAIPRLNKPWILMCVESLYPRSTRTFPKFWFCEYFFCVWKVFTEVHQIIVNSCGVALKGCALK